MGVGSPGMNGWRRLVGVGLMLVVGCGPAGEPRMEEEVVRAANLGRAALENRDSRRALESFGRVVELAPEWPAGWRNLARARLLARDEEGALAALARAAGLEEESAATAYLEGLALVRLSRHEEALPQLERAARLDPRTVAVRYQLASAYQATGRHEPAIEQVRETVRLDPLHSGAHYKLLGYARRAGDAAQVALRERELERLRRLFGEEARSAEAFETCVHTRAEIPAPVGAPELAPIDVRFVDATAELFASPEDGPPGPVIAAAVLDVDGEGRPRLFVIESDGGAGLVLGGRAGSTLERLPLDLTVAATARPIRVAVGDFHNQVPAGVPYDPDRHAQADVLVVSPAGVRLLQATAPGSFEDVTAKAGLAGVGGVAARWVDYEHDGDLDLLLAGAAGLDLWQNDGEGGFREVGAEVGLEVAGEIVDAAAADLDGNVAADLIAAGGTAPTRVFENLRTGRFRSRPEPPGPWPPARRVLVDDLDNDARPDAVLVGESGVTILPGAAPPQRLAAAALEPEAAALADVDNDGRLDLVVGGRAATDPDRGALALWRSAGADGWTEAAAAARLDGDLAPVRELVAVDLDADGDTDLLSLTADGLRFLRNEGGNRNRQLKLRLRGTKTNPGGIGAAVEVVSGAFRLHRLAGSAPLEIGLGGRRRLDAVRVVWTNGIVDNRIEPATDAGVVTLVEPNVAAGSCPFLYAWDGERYRFVTDILGNSPLGLSRARGVPLDADPDELVGVGTEDDLRPRDGAYRLQVTEEMREVLYLDQARLVAADHDPALEVHPTDKLMPAPFPPSDLWAVGSLRSPRSALGGDGVDRTSAVAARDGVFAPPGRPLPPPFRGLTEPLALTLDFGPLDDLRSPVLALTGWLQYGDASTNIAVSQGTAGKGAPPRLEVETAAGGWLPVGAIVGIPAGKTKTILVDLESGLPPGARRLRLVTGLEIRWDRIALGERAAPGAFELHEARPLEARLVRRGFSDIRSRAPGHPTTPEFDDVSPEPPWRTALEGWVTRYGDVLELVDARDGRLTLVAAGDALELAFDAGAFPPPAAGRTRTFFFYSVGWDKDGDPNVIDGDRVEPLPVAAADDDWRLRYNTRWVPFAVQR